MTIKINNAKEKAVLDLNGPEGNAMCLIATGISILKQMGSSEDDLVLYRKKMMSGNYNSIVKNFDSQFSEFIDLKMSEELYNSIFINDEKFL